MHPRPGERDRFLYVRSVQPAGQDYRLTKPGSAPPIERVAGPAVAFAGRPIKHHRVRGTLLESREIAAFGHAHRLPDLKIRRIICLRFVAVQLRHIEPRDTRNLFHPLPRLIYEHTDPPDARPGGNFRGALRIDIAGAPRIKVKTDCSRAPGNGRSCVFPIGDTANLEHSSSCQLAQSRRRIVGRHEVLADQERFVARALEFGDIGRVADATLAHPPNPFGNVFG